MAPSRRSQGLVLPFVAALVAVALLLALAASARAARTAYFADPAADAIAAFSVGAGGALAPLGPVAVHDPHRLAMTPDGRHLYATAEHGVAQFDVAPDGRLTSAGPAAPAGDEPHSLAVHPNGRSVYSTDFTRGKVRQFAVGADGRLAPRDPAYLYAGPKARGVAIDPSGSAAYVLTAGAIVVFDVGADGALTPRDGAVAVPSWSLEDLAFTPDGAHLYVTSSDGRLFSFAVGADRTPVLTGELDVAPGLAPVGVAVAPDGSGVFVAAAGWSGAQSVLAFAVGPDGALTPTSTAAVGGHKPLRYLSASPDGRSLLVAGGDGHLFDVAPGPLLAPHAPPAVDLHAAVGVVVSPNQAPVAAFSAAGGVAGAPAQFDATGALDPDGTIVRYSWDFGDGTVLPDGGPTPQHVYTRPGSYTVTLVVTDNEGASTTTIFTGGTVLGNGAPGASAQRLIVIAAAPPPAPAPAQELRPDLGQTLVAEPVAGRVRVQTPGAPGFVPLESITELPLGSVLDTRRGRVAISTERAKRGGRVQEARFFGGLFRVRQRKRDRYVTELVLRGALAGCGEEGEARAAAVSKRRLWGNGKGRFRTRGRYSSGAVRGTKWLTVDRCDGTLTLVRRGRVAVRDFTLGRTTLVRAGERYLAEAP